MNAEEKEFLAEIGLSVGMGAAMLGSIAGVVYSIDTALQKTDLKAAISTNEVRRELQNDTLTATDQQMKAVLRTQNFLLTQQSRLAARLVANEHYVDLNRHEIQTYRNLCQMLPNQQMVFGERMACKKLLQFVETALPEVDGILLQMFSQREPVAVSAPTAKKRHVRDVFRHAQTLLEPERER